MKNFLIALCIIFCSTQLSAQTKTDKVVVADNGDVFYSCFPKLSDNLPFNIYELGTENINTQQDLYNTIRAKVPGVQITNTQNNNIPKITMRGDSNTIVIIDGIRYTDTSILQTINPLDIEKVYVANSVAASNYLLTKRN
ncbi:MULTISPECIES: Plug domain-containing protein [unclassified Cellulophaga]|uniref:Plug domain-containing protein n=1 Tax=unclassified Cellulophaga TaxID=2634405 RepID=UPI0026E3F411|nr:MULTISPECIES: Plug domain-containing protein [unclassified Cellulophaga]MDO6491543.1 Plug domain-containing protein [Cellulophaga sp. 2_MG-2023]MDO6493420.1 Plug domain-containing protein [Cellulophaga sp. 3_MG-2023]